MILFALLFIGMSSLIGVLGSFLVGHMVPAVSGLSLIAGLALALYLAKDFKLKFQTAPLSVPVFILYSIILTGIYFHSLFLFYEKAGSFWIQNPFNLGDLSFHWSTIRYLAKGAEFWPENPIYLGFRFRYPFGMDFFNAFFENLGVVISTHLPLVTLLALLICFFSLHLAGGPLLVFAVFFSGGFFRFWSETGDVTQLQAGLDFKNLFLTLLLTQRGFLYALPAGVFLYRALQKYFAGEWSPNSREKIALGVLWGGLGFFHLHSFFFLSLYFGLLILWKRDLKNWLLSISVASLLGFPFVLIALWPEAGTNSLIHWSPRGWARQEGTNYFLYWLMNLGPWIVAMVVALGMFGRQKKWNAFVPVALAFGLFVLFSHLILAPWDWDNIKLLVWCYLLGLMGITDLIWNQRSRWVKVAIGLFFIPGFVIFVRSLPIYSRGIQWASERELNKATVLLKDRNVNEGVMIAPTYDHPVLLLGHKLFMGYPGHVWSHGYNYGEREALVNNVYDGNLTVLFDLDKKNVKWIYQGSIENARKKEGFPHPGLSKAGEALDHQLYGAALKME